MLNDIYNKRILELAADIPRQGRLPKPDASATAHSKLCGSTVTVDLAMDGDRMLKENGAPPTGRWEDIAVLEPVRDYKARHASTLLTFDAVVDAIARIAAARAEAGQGRDVAAE